MAHGLRTTISRADVEQPIQIAEQRELGSTAERLAERSEAKSIERPLPQKVLVGGGEETLKECAQKLLGVPVHDKISATLNALIQEALEQSQGNITKAAQELGRHRKFVERYLKKKHQ